MPRCPQKNVRAAHYLYSSITAFTGLYVHMQFQDRVLVTLFFSAFLAGALFALTPWCRSPPKNYKFFLSAVLAGIGAIFLLVYSDLLHLVMSQHDLFRALMWAIGVAAWAQIGLVLSCRFLVRR